MKIHSSIDSKTTLGISGIGEGVEKSHVLGFIRLKAGDDAVALPNHVILVLDLSLSMSGHIKQLKESIKRVIDRMQPHRDKCTIIGFAGETKVICKFARIGDLQDEFFSKGGAAESITVMNGTTDFKAGLQKTISIVDELASMYPLGCESIGNEIMEWVVHNHITIFMTDGKNYGNVPWSSAEQLATRHVTLHTVGLTSKDIDKNVRKILLKMARLGGGGFNFSKTIEEFDKKVNTLLELSLDAVTRPAILRISPADDVKLINSTMLGHFEQHSEEANPEFVFPALKATDRKILLFTAQITKAFSKNSRVKLLNFSMEPNYLDNSDTEVMVSVMPKKNYILLMKKGINAELKVHMLMYNLEREINDELENAAEIDNISMFKAKVQSILDRTMELVEKSFNKHPKRSMLEENITALKLGIEESKTIVDPKEFFSTIYALMRTTR